MLTDSARNNAVDGITAAVTYIGLADRSLTELTGGSPAYARKAVAWDAAASGQAAQDGALVFDVPASTEVCFVLLRTAVSAGTDKGWFPVGGYSPQVAVVTASSDQIDSKGHGYTDGMQVVVFDIQAAGTPTGLTEGTIYYVVSSATDSFKLAATAGGSAINITADGEMGVQRVLPESFAAQGTYTIADAALVVDARFA